MCWNDEECIAMVKAQISSLSHACKVTQCVRADVRIRVERLKSGPGLVLVSGSGCSL